MSKFELTILGTNSSMPSGGRMLNSHVLNVNTAFYLIDCGEGTQLQMSKYKIKRNSIEAIFISHLHGDHIFGLPGLIGSFVHFSRVEPLTIIGPKGLKEYVNSSLQIANSVIDFEIKFIELEDTEPLVVYEDEFINVTALPLKHSTPTYGYLFSENEGKIDVLQEKIQEYGLKFDHIKALKQGNSILLSNGDMLTPEDCCTAPEIPKTYAYISDTVYDEDLIPYLYDIDILFHEATFLQGMQEEAARKHHSTIDQAATIGVSANVKALIVGHFSPRYEKLDQFEKQASMLYPDMIVAKEGIRLSI